MNGCVDTQIEAWEGEGGAAPDPFGVSAIAMSGTPNQVEWAERIKHQVNLEFDRLAASPDRLPIDRMATIAPTRKRLSSSSKKSALKG
jgi:hypothetical protein